MNEKKKTDEVAPDAGAPPDEAAARGRTRGRRMLVIGAAALAGVLIAGAALIASWGGGAPSPRDAAPSPSATPTATPRPGAAPGGTPAEGSEVPDPDEAAPEASGPGGAEPTPDTTPFVGTTLPSSGSATGELVEGFPEPIMTPMTESDVLDSSIATEGDAMQVTLVARSTASPDEIREHYRSVWAGSGLEPAGTQASGAAFANASTSLTLAFTPESGTGTVYVLFGVFRSR